MSGVNEYDTTPGNNSTINSVNVAEGCAPSGINNALRQLMADIKDVEGVQTKTGAYTIVKADYGNLMEWTTAATATMTAVATLGDNWYCYIWANGVDVVVDGDGSETINGATTLDLPSGSWARVWSDGTELHALVTNGNRGNSGRNKITNALFRVDIEVNSSGVTASADHVVEGWRGSHSTDVTTLTTSRIAGEKHQYALQMEVTTGSDSSLAAGQWASLVTSVEGRDVAELLWGTSDAKPLFVTFWAKASVAGTYALGIVNSAGDRGYVEEVALTSTLQKFEIEVPGDTTGTWSVGTNIGFLLYLSGASGTTYQGTNETWNASYAYTTSSCTNWLATNGATITLEAPTASGSGFIEPENIPYSEDVARCKRYYETSYNNGSAPGTNSAVGVSFGEELKDTTARVWFGSNQFETEKRAIPTMTIYSVAGNSGYISVYNNTGGTELATTGPVSPSTRHGGYYLNVTAPAANELYTFHWVADSRLI